MLPDIDVTAQLDGEIGLARPWDPGSKIDDLMQPLLVSGAIPLNLKKLQKPRI